MFKKNYAYFTLPCRGLGALTNYYPSVFWRCWLGHLTCKIISDVTYNVFGGTLNLLSPEILAHGVKVHLV